MPKGMREIRLSLKPPSSPGELKLATILFESGPDRGSGVELSSDRTYSIGRDPRCDVVVRDELVSRQHAKIKEYKGAWYVRDLNSTNGVYVNDKKVSQSEIQFGDKLQIGNVVLTFLEESLDQVRKEQTLGGYKLRQRIGRGGMGTVFRALQVSLGREIALKVLSPDLVRDRKFVDQFFREARAAGALNHPHIVQVYDVGQEGDTYYYSMEYIEGGSLEDRLRDEGKLSVDESLEIAWQAAQALEYAEGRHIVHRDIKPDNLMLTEAGQVKIADLGLAFSMQESASQSGQPILGTPHFISPEQALRREIDIRSDIYSLGATMYRMLTGETLFHGKSAEEIIRKAVKETPVPIREINPSVPDKVAALVHRMVEKVPEDRFETASDLREAIEQVRGNKTKTIVLWSAVAVASIAVAAVIYLIARGPTTEIIKETIEDQESKQAAFQALNELQQREMELAAVRAYYQIMLDTEDPDRRLTQLQTWYEENNFLPIPESRQAADRISNLEQSITQQREQDQLLAQQQQAQLTKLQTDFQSALESSAFLQAAAVASAIDPAAASDPDHRQALTALQTDFLEQAATQELELYDATLAQVQEARAIEDLEQAYAICTNALEQLLVPEEHRSLPLATVVQDHRDQLARIANDLQEARLSDALATRKTDLRNTISALGNPFRQSVLELDFAGARTHLNAVANQIQTPEYVSVLQAVEARLKQAESLTRRFEAALADGTLNTERPLRAEGDSGEIVGVGSRPGTLKLSFDRGVGSVSQEVSYADFADAEGYRDLLWGRLEFTPEERLTLVETMAFLQVVHWGDRFAVLHAGLRNYDPKVGWNPNLFPAWEYDTAQDAVSAVIADLQAVSDDEQKERLQEVHRRYAREQACADQLRIATSPFWQESSSIGWNQAEQLLREVLQEQRATLLVKLTYSLLDANYKSQLVDRQD